MVIGGGYILMFAQLLHKVFLQYKEDQTHGSFSVWFLSYDHFLIYDADANRLYSSCKNH